MNAANEIIKLCVGKERTILNVHEGVLSKSSIYFRNAMEPCWADKRNDPDTIELPDDPVSVVNLYVTWLYTGKILVEYCTRATEADEENADIVEQYCMLLHCQTLATRYLDADFWDIVSGHIRELNDDMMSAEVEQRAYEESLISLM